jgi:predicted enzyme related to lactoylglutathione lyase
MTKQSTTIRLDAVLIASPHPEALAEFYQRGFKLQPPTHYSEDHLGLNLANSYLGFDRLKESTPHDQSTISIWFKVEDIQDTYERLLRSGAKVKYPPTKEESPGEILAMVFDPDGNQIGLISDIKG